MSERGNNLGKDNDSILNENVSYETIKKIAKRIDRIKDKKHLISIINIIKTMNPNVTITENDNGLFVRFNELTPSTYTKLENYIHKNFPKKSFDDSETTTTSEYIPYSQEDIATINDKYKLSNKEKNLIKKQKYSQIMS